MDTDVQTYLLDSFAPIDYTTEDRPDGLVYIFDVSTLDGIFTTRIYATGEFVDVHDTILAPTQVKIDIIIHDFNYLDDSSLLALKVKTEISGEVEYDDDTEDEEDGRSNDEAELELVMNDYIGFFSWKETAEVDGVVQPVNSSFVKVEDDEQKLYLIYPHGSEIIHDPKVGIANALRFAWSPPSIIDALASNYLVIAALVLVTSIGLLVIIRRR